MSKKVKFRLFYHFEEKKGVQRNNFFITLGKNWDKNRNLSNN